MADKTETREELWADLTRIFGLDRPPRPMPDPDGDPDDYSAWLRIAGPIAIGPADDPKRQPPKSGGYGSRHVATKEESEAFWAKIKEKDRKAYREQQEKILAARRQRAKDLGLV